MLPLFLFLQYGIAGKYEQSSYISAANRYDALKDIEDVHWVESGHAATYVAYELDDGKFVRYC